MPIAYHCQADNQQDEEYIFYLIILISYQESRRRRHRTSIRSGYIFAHDVHWQFHFLHFQIVRWEIEGLRRYPFRRNG